MKDFLRIFLDLVIGAFFGVALYCIITVDTPTALDVYRGKTTSFNNGVSTMLRKREWQGKTVMLLACLPRDKENF